MICRSRVLAGGGRTREMSARVDFGLLRRWSSMKMRPCPSESAKDCRLHKGKRRCLWMASMNLGHRSSQDNSRTRRRRTLQGSLHQHHSIDSKRHFWATPKVSHQSRCLPARNGSSLPVRFKDRNKMYRHGAHTLGHAGADGRLLLYSLSDFTFWRAMEHNTLGYGGINDVAWSPDSQYIASASDDKTVKVFEAHTVCLPSSKNSKSRSRPG